MRAKGKKEINVLVGENIRYYREEAGFSREKLAELASVSPRFLADVELGFVGISLTTLKRLCEVLGISADRILWRQEDGDVTLLERLQHVDPAYLEPIGRLIQQQLELIALVTREETRKKTRN